jgi:pimeloyl-ACP methyl ester carboxylesterase
MIETIRITAPDGAVTGARCAGDRGPALIFVHGVGSTAAVWDDALDEFARDFRCAAIELRGNGALHPDPDPSAISREGYARDVLAVADARGMQTFTIVGCSLGGVVAFELWKTVPERIDAMVIVGSFARYPNAQQYADGISQAVRDAGDMRTFAATRVPKLGLPPARAAVTLEQMASKSVQSYLAATQATWTGDYTSLLSSIDVPVLVLHGVNDAIAPAELSRAIADGIPNAELDAVPDAGHVANADNPAAFNARVRRFLMRTVSS